MADTNLQVRFKHPYKTEAEWEATTTIPKAGEALYTSGGLRHGWMKLGNGTDLWKDLPYIKPTYDYSEIQPLKKQTYTNVYCSSNSDPAGYLYFATVKPENYNKSWRISYRLKATINGISNGYQYSEVTIDGARNTYAAYKIYNAINNTSYRPLYSHVYHAATETGLNNNYNHLLGFRFQSSYNPHVVANSRIIEIEILEEENCTLTFLDSMTLFADMPGANTTNYGNTTNGVNATRVAFDGVTQGYSVSGDRNTYPYFTTAYYTKPLAGTNGIKQYSLIMEDSSGNYQSFTTDYGTGTSKTKNTTGFKLGKLYYASTSSNWASGSRYGNDVTRAFQYGVDARYSFNCGQTLTVNAPIYLVGTYNNASGLFYLDDTWYTQTLPTTEDGKIYIYLGFTYSNYTFDFVGYSTPLWFKDGAIRPFVANEATSSVAGLMSAEDKDKLDTFTMGAATMPGGVGKAVGWYRIAKIGNDAAGYPNFSLYITGGWQSGSPTIGEFNISVRDSGARITQISAITGQVVSKIRLIRIGTTGGNYFVDVYQNFAYNSSQHMGEQVFKFIGHGALNTYDPEAPLTGDDANATATVEFTLKDNGMVAPNFYGNATTANEAKALITTGDNRSVATSPNDYNNKIIFAGLKNKATVNNPSNDTYSYVVGLRGWGDSSGGKAHEFAFNNSGIFTRMGSLTTWESWRELLDSSNYSSYAVPKTGGTFTGNVTVNGNLETKGGMICDMTSGPLSSYIELDNGVVAYYLSSSSNNITDTPYHLAYNSSVDTENTDTTYHWGVLNLKALTDDNGVLSNEVYESSLYTNYDGHLAIDSGGVDFILPSGGIIINPDAEIFTDGKITMSNGSRDAISIDPIGNYPSITLTGSTAASNAYNSNNPRIEFQNADASQNIQLIYTDFDAVQAPASLTLAGNQGGEYFIAPNIKATGTFYGNLSGNVTGNLTGNVSGNATTASYLQGLSSRATAAGWGNQNGTVLSAYGTSGGGGWVLRQNGGQMNMIIDGFYYQNEGNNLVLDTANYTSYVSSVRDAGNGAATKFQYSATGMNYGDYTWLAGWSGYTLKAVNKSQFLASTGGTLSGSLTVLKSSGESQLIASNGTNKIYLYANSDGRVGLYYFTANNSSGAIISRGNNTHAVTFGNSQGNVLTYSYNYSGAPPVVSNTGSTTRVSHMAGHASYLAVMVYPDTASWTNKTINFSSSDIRLKKNIAEPDLDALPVINSITMHSFDWKDAHKYKHQPLGMVADELEEIDPRFAVGGGYDEEGNMLEKSVDTFYLVGYLVKAVQELSAEVDRLKNKQQTEAT